MGKEEFAGGSQRLYLSGGRSSFNETVKSLEACFFSPAYAFPMPRNSRHIHAEFPALVSARVERTVEMSHMVSHPLLSQLTATWREH